MQRQVLVGAAGVHADGDDGGDGDGGVGARVGSPNAYADGGAVRRRARLLAGSGLSRHLQLTSVGGGDYDYDYDYDGDDDDWSNDDLWMILNGAISFVVDFLELPCCCCCY